jgi:hypothetical protein
VAEEVKYVGTYLGREVGLIIDAILCKQGVAIISVPGDIPILI